MSKLSEQIAKSLGSENSYAVFSDKWDPSLLNPLPRKSLREENNISPSMFFGADIWHCYEATFLLNNGMPIAGTLKIIIPEESEFLPESKSLKLFLNSFDMCKMGSTIEEAVTNYEATISTQLSISLKEDRIVVNFFLMGDGVSESPVEYDLFDDLQIVARKEILNKEDNFYSKEIFTDYKGEKNHLEVEGSNEEGNFNFLKVKTNILRSRCRHTKQKDTGTAFICMLFEEGKRITPLSLLQQIVSLREVNEFHELCAEKLFKEIMETGVVRKLSVQLIYARRGSLDICPVRTNDPDLILGNLIDPYQYTYKQMSQ